MPSLTVTEMNRSALKLLGLQKPPFGAPLIDVIRMPVLIDIVNARQGWRDRARGAHLAWPAAAHDPGHRHAAARGAGSVCWCCAT